MGAGQGVPYHKSLQNVLIVAKNWLVHYTGSGFYWV